MDIWKVPVSFDGGGGFDLFKKNKLVGQGWPGDASWIFYLYRSQELSYDELDYKSKGHYYWTNICWNDTAARAYNAFKRLIIDINPGDICLAFDGLGIIGIGQVPEKFVYLSSKNYDNKPEGNWLFPFNWISWNDFITSINYPIEKTPTAPMQGIIGIMQNGQFNEVLKEYWTKFKDSSGYGYSHYQQELNSLLKEFDNIKQKNKLEIISRIRNMKTDEIKSKVIESLVTIKKQVILQGPPGSGKTRLSKLIAVELINETRNDLSMKYTEFGELPRDQAMIIQFHPSYSYEDFIRGIVAKVGNSQSVEYEVINKTFMTMVSNAVTNREKNHVIIIDEINRANLASVLGELIYAMEYRGNSIESMYTLKDGTNQIIIPDNLFIIGTMNTADRSVGNIDYAIRRRFMFVHVPIDEAVISYNKALVLFKEVLKLFKGNEKKLSPEFDSEDVMIGHSYFLIREKINEDGIDRDTTDDEKIQELKLRLEFELIPILKEYVKDGILLGDDETISKIDNLKNVVN